MVEKLKGTQFYKSELPFAKRQLKLQNSKLKLRKTLQPKWHKNMGLKWKPLQTIE